MKEILETERLKLREFVLKDAKDLLEIFADGGMPHLAQFGPLNIEYAKEFIKRMLTSYKENGFGLWAVLDKTNDKLIGYCGIHKIKINDSEIINELAYRIYKKLWGKGLATEAAKSVKNYAFKILKLPEIVSCIVPENFRSIRVAEKTGLVYWKNGKFRGQDCQIYRMKNSELLR